MHSTDRAAGPGRFRRWLVAIIFAGGIPLNAFPQTAPAQDEMLTEMSVDDLMNVEVTTVARRGQKLLETSAATFVITQEDIRRSQATNIADLLRMVPGFNVAEINRNLFAVSARGFNGRWANKLLVLIDGRSVYDPLFSGVLWNTLDTYFEDIERIEVTRGPGGTLWGANATNGIVNIITKHPVDTQGITATVSHSLGGGPTVGARYGGRFGESGYYRAYVKAFDIPESTEGANDDSKMLRSGFRSEWTTGFGAIDVQGGAFKGESAENTAAPTLAVPRGGLRRLSRDVTGHDFLMRWTNTQSARSETEVQAYYDYSHRYEPALTERRTNYDIDFQHHLTLGSHDTTWGLGFRAKSYDCTREDHILYILPGRDRSTLFTAFVQDEIRVASNLRFTLGTKILHELGKTQWQPTLRALWTPGPNTTAWAAMTNTVRSPSQFELGSFTPLEALQDENGQPMTAVIYGNPELKAESARSFEIGYRVRANAAVSLDVTAFHNELDRIRQDAIGAPKISVRGNRILPISYTNGMKGSTSGIEALATLRPHERWDVTAAYTFWNANVSDSATGSNAAFAENDVPRHQFNVRSYLTLTSKLELDTAIYYVGAVAMQDLPAYVRADLRLGWQVTPHLELSLAGRNLTGEGQIEFNGRSESAALTPVSRTVTGTITWRP